MKNEMIATGFFEDYKGKAVLLRGAGISPLCMIEVDQSSGIFKPKKGNNLLDVMCFQTKKDAEQTAKDLSFSLNSIVKYSGRVWAIRYDFKSRYLLSPKWNDEIIRSVVLSCKQLRHKWTDGLICDHCGKRKADIREHNIIKGK